MVVKITTKLPQLGNAPSRDRPEQLDDDAEDLLAKLPPLQQSIDQFSAEANALAEGVSDLAQRAEASATAAASAAAAAGAALWVSGRAYALGAAVVDPADLFVYRCKQNTSGTTRPGLASAFWKNVSVIAPSTGNLTDAATVTWDAAAIQMATLVLAGDRTIAAPTNLVPGVLVLHIKQDAVGGRAVVFDPAFVFIEDVAPQIDAGPNRRTILSFICDGTNLFGSYLPGFTK